MSLKFGFVIAILSLVIGYLGSGGNLHVLLQPFEWLEIIGIAIGTFIISNPKPVQKALFANFHKIGKNSPYSRTESIEFLSSIFQFLKYANGAPLTEIEKQIDNPKQSNFFHKLYLVPNGEELIKFFCDYFRLTIMGFNKSHELEAIMDNHIDEKRIEIEKMADALLRLGDSLPALGIIVAVLGVVTAMGAVGAEPSILGARIASALIGTFIGVFLSYGIVTPIGLFLQKFCLEETLFFEAIKVAIISHVNGNPPSISIEFVRQTLPETIKPSFTELENKII
ncbi:MAG: motility-associated protein [Candidatus Midichloria sp.]|uniref:Flagellar motor protein MotA n=1 Tax=Hyalomma marginatum TaxID=34627 RepID=A0A8S4BVZ0_9ACAR|nr:flagellar motor protein MotA [Hyalomma marginatum]CAG7591839.1 flagellar motor protein MotA [Hyalomma marginatum]